MQAIFAIRIISIKAKKHMKFLFVVISILSTFILTACSSGPKDEEVIAGTKAIFAVRGMLFDSVKNLGCEKSKSEQIKEPGEFWQCRVELTGGSQTGKETMYFQKVGENWVPRIN
jgi:hypothetical protein